MARKHCRQCWLVFGEDEHDFEHCPGIEYRGPDENGMAYRGPEIQSIGGRSCEVWDAESLMPDRFR